MRPKGYLVSSIVTALLGEAALVVIVLLMLPRLGINIPMWVLILLMVAFGAYEGISYRIGSKALRREPVVSPEAMVGCHGKASMLLAPDGYVQVNGELWRALSTGPNIDKGDEIVVVEVRRLTLIVAHVPNNNRIEDVASQ
jgi:membrane-bound ClpP family serine protease